MTLELSFAYLPRLRLIFGSHTLQHHSGIPYFPPTTSPVSAMKPIFRAQNAIIQPFTTPFSFEIAQQGKTAVFGPLKTSLLERIAGKVPDPTKRISFPGIGQDLWPSQAIQFTKFGQSTSSNAQAPFVGARYESFRDEFDVSLRTFLQSKAPERTPLAKIEEIAAKLDLQKLLDNWFVGLSNGQSRRAQLALALLREPRMLVMDEPFLGLDPTNRNKFSQLLERLTIPVVLGLRTNEDVPKWIRQTLYASETSVFEGTEAQNLVSASQRESRQHIQVKLDELVQRKSASGSTAPVIEFKDVTVGFPNAPKPLFEKLSLVVNDGQRVHLRGPNGSGKSTLLALITADHPQVWSQDISLFGERLRVGKHSYFKVNQWIGHSSPEVHAIFPKYLTARRAIGTAFSGTMQPLNKTSPQQNEAIEEVASALNIDVNDTTPFGEMPVSAQKLVLFARALVKKPRILILDEAFSSMSSSQMARAFELLDQFKGAVILVGHVDEEIPICDKVISLK